jgi:hypothetical protein
MAKKPICDDSTFLGFTKVNGVRVPFWEDNKPLDLEESLGLHKDVKSITIAHSPRSSQSGPKRKPQ